jgi:hypothetical protein
VIRQIHALLVATARARRVVTYQRVAAQVGLSLTSASDRERLARTLHAIAVAEHAAGRPLLTAVVVLRARGRPGRGFTDLVRELGLHRGVDDAECWRREVDAAYSCWGTPDSS